MRSVIVIAFIIASIQILNCHGTPNSRLNFFDIDLLRYTAEGRKGNVMVSPASIKSMLAMLLEGAEGATASELKSALRVSPEKEDFRDELSFFVKSLQANSSNAFLQSTNALFVSKNLKLKRAYENIVKNLYNSEVLKIDFSNPKATVDIVNTWVNGKTKGLIPAIVEEVQVPPTTEMVMASALYFKGSWKHGFDPKSTHGDCFYNNGICTNVAMMDLQTELNYAFVENLRSHALELPYKDARYSMILLIPEDRDSGLALFRDLPYVGLPQILDSLYPADVILNLPKFDVEYEEDLVGALKKMHISSLFAQTANLSGIYESGEDYYVNSIYHSVHMKVDEEGTVAAAATASLIVPLINNQVQLRVDRPFVFFIRDNILGLNLFEGKIEEPTKYEGSNTQGHRQPEKKNPAPSPQPSRSSTAAPAPSSPQSFQEANPHYDHGGPYQPPLYHEIPHHQTVSHSTQSSVDINQSQQSTQSPRPVQFLNSDQPDPYLTAHVQVDTSQQTKKPGGITGFFRKLGSYF